MNPIVKAKFNLKPINPKLQKIKKMVFCASPKTNPQNKWLYSWFWNDLEANT